eukprot:2079903-Rhodomonas_salina.1
MSVTFFPPSETELGAMLVAGTTKRRKRCRSVPAAVQARYPLRGKLIERLLFWGQQQMTYDKIFRAVSRALFLAHIQVTGAFIFLCFSSAMPESDPVFGRTRDASKTTSCRTPPPPLDPCIPQTNSNPTSCVRPTHFPSRTSSLLGRRRVMKDLRGLRCRCGGGNVDGWIVGR